MKLEFVPPDQLVPYERNPRTSDDALAAVVRSIEEYGFNAPIVVDEGYRICAGHVRWRAACKIGMDRVPVVRVHGLRGEAFAAYNIADNQTASLSDWESEELASLLEELQHHQIDLTPLGFSDAQLRALLAPQVSFDWDAFDEHLRSSPLPKQVSLPVKVPRTEVGGYKEAIRACAKQHRLTDRDAALLAGRIFGLLLGIAP